jgi:hypothetical protein
LGIGVSAGDAQGVMILAGEPDSDKV